MRKSLFVAAAFATAFAAAAVLSPAQAQSCGPGMMGGYGCCGYGMMGGGYGPGYGMMGGYGPGMMGGFDRPSVSACRSPQ